jgi:hypothetical protein
MARKTSSSDDTEQTSEPTSRAAILDTGATADTTGGGQAFDVDAGMRRETHGELPSERPPSDF